MARRSISSAIQLSLLALFVALSPAARASSYITSVQASNVVDTSFTVTWITAEAVPGSGSVCYGTTTTSIGCRIPESPNVAGARGDVHSATVANLSPSTTYYYYVTVSSYVGDNNGSPFSLKTGPTLPTPSPTYVATGKVVVSSPNGASQPASGVLVLLHVLDSTGTSGQPVPATSSYLSVMTQSDGTFSLPVRPRSADSSQAFTIPSNGSGDALLYSVEGGADGVVGPLSAGFPSAPGSIALPVITLVPSSATVTPIPATATSTPAPTATSIPAPVTATPTFTPEAPARPTPLPPTVEPAIESAAPPTTVETAEPIEPPPIATLVPPPSPAAPAPAEAPPPLPTLPPPSISTQASVVTPTPAFTVTPMSTTIPATAAPPILPAPGQFEPPPRGTLTGFRSPATRTPTLATAEPSPVNTTVADDSVARKLPSDDTLNRATIALVASLGLIAVGILVVTVGIVRQVRQS
jgi:hypothetical protein